MSGTLRWIERLLWAVLVSFIVFCAWRIDDRANRTEQYARQCVTLIQGTRP